MLNFVTDGDIDLTGPALDATLPGRDAPLTVLVVGTDEWAIEQGVDAVAGAGHRVLRCHEPGAPAFPCNALRPGGVCPLDVGFEVVLTVRGRLVSVPVQAEFGVVCGLRAGARLVIGGLSEGNPLAPWADAVVERSGHLGAAIDEVSYGSGGQPAVGERSRV
jgi:hypothetical protein